MSINPSALPEHLEVYKRTDTFTQGTIPKGLLNDHSTKDGTWGLIIVESGCLQYSITDPRRPSSDVELDAGGAPGIVEPTIRHRVVPLGPVRFHVQFLREQAEKQTSGSARQN